MKEIPILFKPEMVKAILEGRKTQTRRVVKHIPALGEPDNWCHLVQDRAIPFERSLGDFRAYCPYGTVGDRLWVRESFDIIKTDSIDEREAKFRAAQNIDSTESLMKYSEMPSGGGEEVALYRADYGEWATNPDSDLGPWKPSIHMPRWASRLTLEVTDIRVERLQGITEEDAKAEGIEMLEECQGSYSYALAKLWNSIHGKGGNAWRANPWVWAIAFKRVEAKA